MDILDGLNSVNVCTGYQYKGKTFKELPHDLEAVRRARPRYKELPGWSKTVDNTKRRRRLDPNAKKYLKFLEDAIGVKISTISIGSAREETLYL